jgi:hypothetical protein
LNVVESSELRVRCVLSAGEGAAVPSPPSVAERMANRRQRDVDDRDVHDHHELGHAQERQDGGQTDAWTARRYVARF